MSNKDDAEGVWLNMKYIIIIIIIIMLLISWYKDFWKIGSLVSGRIYKATVMPIMTYALETRAET